MVKTKSKFYFVGVTTSESSINQVFPRWMKVLDRTDVELEGVDHQLNDSRKAYRQTVDHIKNAPQVLGALVTSHKINILNTASDLFDYLGPNAKITGEVSCISKQNKSLEGYAKDPITSGRSLEALLDDDYFSKTGSHVMIIGAGGSGTAISLYLMKRKKPIDRPERIIVINRSKPNLDKLRNMVENFGTSIEFQYVLNEEPERNDEIMSELPEGSIVINATGLGKDRPGSPITDAAVFPRKGIAWEINYRGELDFWHQAMAQKEDRELIVEDGWLYFLHGWTEHISEVLDIVIDKDRFQQLAKVARDIHPEHN